MAPLGAHGHLAITSLPLGKLEPYYAPYVTLKIADGSLDLATDYTTVNANAPAPKLDNLSLALTQVRVVTPGVKEPLWRVAQFAVRARRWICRAATSPSPKSPSRTPLATSCAPRTAKRSTTRL